MKAPLHFLFFFLAFSVSAQQTDLKNQPAQKKSRNESARFQALADSSNLYFFEGDYEKSLATNRSLLEQAEKRHNQKYVQQAYRMLGYDHLALDQIPEAREYFEKAVSLAQGSKNEPGLALAYLDLATFYSNETENFEKAFGYFDRAIMLYGRLNDSAGLAKAHYNAVLAAFKAGDHNTAYLHILRARRLNGFGERSATSIGLDYLSGKYYAIKGNETLATRYFLKAIADAEAENLPETLQEAYKYYAEALYSQNKPSAAYKTLMKYEAYKAENRAKLKSSEIDALSLKYQLAKYRKDMRAAELENQLQAEIASNRGRLNTILIVISASFLLMFLALFVAFRKRKSLVKELKIKNAKYLAAKERSEKLAKDKSRFFSTVSHELRTPLYGVIGLTSILLEDKSLAKHKKNLKSLKFSADYLLALINDVLQLNKLDSNTIEDEQSVFNLEELISGITASFEYARAQHSNRITINISPEIPAKLRGNAVRLSQILMNLIGNACKFTENGDIFIIAENLEPKAATAYVRIAIKDTGRGISAQDKELIFDEFLQLQSDNGSEGSGLGLPIVKKLLSLSNAVLNVESEVGKGSAFSFSLLFDVVQSGPATKTKPVLPKKKLKRKKILVVEDNRINQVVTKKILENNKMACTIAENGEVAIAEIKKGEFDLILMDINMPVKNGIEATKEIRFFDKTLPIIALTAVDMKEMRQEIFDCGMNDIIVKPYDVSKFLQTILKNLPETASEKQSPSEKSSVSLD